MQYSPHSELLQKTMSTITDDRTPNLDLPLPYAQNQLSDDVERLRQALTTLDTEIPKKAPIASPIFTGDPKAPTPASTDSDTSIATTAFVRAAMALFGIGNTTNAPLMADMDDTTLGAGLYATSGTVLNPPPQATSSTGVVLHKLYGTAGFQLFNQYGSATLLYRSRANGTWQPWARVGSDALAAVGLGLTTNQPNWPNTSLNNCAGVTSGVYRTTGTNTDFPAGYPTFNVVEFYLRDAVSAGQFNALQILHNVPNNKHFMRTAQGTGAADAPAWSAWKEIAVTDSPAFTGNPTAPTAAAGTNTTQLATTAFVAAAIAPLAPLASPALTGNPTAPTPTVGDNDTSIATTAFVQQAMAAFGLGAGGLKIAGNLNDPTIRPGWYLYAGDNGGSNGPTIYGVVLVSSNALTATTSWANQIFFSTDGRFYYRFNVNNATAWSPWQEVWHSGVFNPASKQDALGFTPVQQGGGTGQGVNKLKIGWLSTSKLGLMVDNSDFGSNWPIDIGGNCNVANAALKWNTARNLALSGDDAGSVNIDGSGNVTLAVTRQYGGATPFTYANGWGDRMAARYRKDPNGGRVRLSGLVHRNYPVTNLQLIATLPAGYRPPYERQFTVPCSATAGLYFGSCNISIGTDGSIVFTNANNDPSTGNSIFFLCLDGVSFFVDA